MRIRLPQSQNQNNTEPLHHAVNSRNIQRIEYLLNNNVIDVNAKNSRGNTPLFLAVQEHKSYYDIAKLLIAKNADINAPDNFGITPLHRAILYSRFDIAELLIENKANVNLQMMEGQTALHVAAETLPLKKVKPLLELLLTHKADINIKDSKGKAAIHFAYDKGHHDTVKWLIANGANLLIPATNTISGQGTSARQGLFAQNTDDFKELHKDNFGAFLSKQGLSYDDPKVVKSLWKTWIKRLSAENPSLSLNINSKIEIQTLKRKQGNPDSEQGPSSKRQKT